MGLREKKEMLCGELLEAIEKKFLLNARRAKGEKDLDKQIDKVSKKIKIIDSKLKVFCNSLIDHNQGI